MVAGEFAVLEPYHQLVVMAVNRFVYATIKESSTNKLYLKDFNLYLNWYLSDGKVHIKSEDKRINFVESAMNISYRYLSEKLI